MGYNSKHLSSSLKIFMSEIVSLDLKDEIFRDVSIVDVLISKGGSTCTIYFYTLNKQFSLVEEKLNSLSNFFKAKISNSMSLKKIPNIFFKYDGSIDKASKIEEIFEGMKK